MTLGMVTHWRGDRDIPRGWWLADGSRLRRRDDPALYDLLRDAGYHNRWRRWIVHLPDLRSTPLMPHEFRIPGYGGGHPTPMPMPTIPGGEVTEMPMPQMTAYSAIIRGSQPLADGGTIGDCGDTTCTEEHP